MTNPRQLRVLGLALCIGVPLASSCAREENALEPGGSGDEGGTASSTAGSKAVAGSGSSTAGSSSAFGGTNGASGSAAGGKPGTAGASAQGGEGGSDGVAGTAGGGGRGGAGGSGGTGGVPPEVLENADVIVYYENQSSAVNGIIKLRLQLKNQSADPLPLASVKIRYWFTAEVTPSLHQYYTGGDIVGPMAAFVDDGANSHALLTFGGGSIAKGADMNKSEVQLQADNGTGVFQQADDFSFVATAKSLTPNDKVTLYLADELIWGCEPSGKCAGGDPGAGGASGSGGASDSVAGQPAGGAP